MALAEVRFGEIPGSAWRERERQGPQGEDRAAPWRRKGISARDVDVAGEAGCVAGHQGSRGRYADAQGIAQAGQGVPGCLASGLT